MPVVEANYLRLTIMLAPSSPPEMGQLSAALVSHVEPKDIPDDTAKTNHKQDPCNSPLKWENPADEIPHIALTNAMLFLLIYNSSFAAVVSDALASKERCNQPNAS